MRHNACEMNSLNRGKLLLLVICSSVFLGIVASAQDLPYRLGLGDELVFQCKAYVRVTSNPNGEYSDDDIAARSNCSGYVEGFIDGLRAGMPSPSHEWATSGFCLNGASIDTLIRVYLTFMGANPKYLDESEGKSLTLALRDSYPCHTKH
jgi:hypothetical protein